MNKYTDTEAGDKFCAVFFCNKQTKKHTERERKKKQQTNREHKLAQNLKFVRVTFRHRSQKICVARKSHEKRIII